MGFSHASIRVDVPIVELVLFVIIFAYACFTVMISIEQWRTAIGSFRTVIDCGCNTAKDFVFPAIKARILFLTVLWCVVDIACAVCLYNVGKLLIICSNDVEFNPGPVIYKTCPNCGNEVVHIKKKSVPVDTFSAKHLLVNHTVVQLHFQLVLVMLRFVLLHVLLLVCVRTGLL